MSIALALSSLHTKANEVLADGLAIVMTSKESVTKQTLKELSCHQPQFMAMVLHKQFWSLKIKSDTEKMGHIQKWANSKNPHFFSYSHETW